MESSRRHGGKVIRNRMVRKSFMEKMVIEQNQNEVRK